jgi:hypothetical protein
MMEPQKIPAWPFGSGRWNGWRTMDERSSWDRLDGEPGLWWQRFDRFRLLGPERSILGLFNRWRLDKSRGVSTSAPKSWRDAAVQWRWRARAEAWDEHCRAQAAAEAEAERLKVLSSGYAQQHERVRKLGEVADLLLAELNEYDRRWLKDVKGIGGEKNFREVEIERFNAGILEEFRKYLEDIAAEMGERVQQHKVQIDQPPLIVMDK